MEDSVHNDVQTLSSEAGSLPCKIDSKLTLVASHTKPLSHTLLKKIPLFKDVKAGKMPVHDVALFLLKVGALEIVRRLSKARCHFVWSGLQVLQVFCYPPLKWLQRWDPFSNIIKGAQMLSRPLLVLSIATTFFDQSERKNLDADDIDDSDRRSDCDVVPESHSELLPVESTVDVRVDDQARSHQSSTNWLLDLYRELENQGVRLPER
ncbi:uncharacterized protein [Rutidosis leptorrhynchoides]|uniref:uncharacterized protein n=1 Tax=Rutidosis leptorrhynchoides TaxID=125765 RepID=UPI003A9905C8